MANNQIVLKGTTSYYECLVPDVAAQLESGGLVFLHDLLMTGCNYNCIKCFSERSSAYRRQLKERDITVAKLDESTRRDLFAEANALGVRSIVIAGAGEPFMSKDLDGIVELASSFDMNLIIFTNGSLLDKVKVDDYFSKGISVVFNFDSINESFYDILTGTQGFFQKALSNLKDAIELSERHSYHKEGYKIVQLAVNTNPSSLTYDISSDIDEIKGIHEMIQGRAAHFVSHPTASGNAIKNWSLLAGKKNCMWLDESSTAYLHNKTLDEAEQNYSTGLGRSSRRKEGKCSYIYNGVVQFEGWWMMCPNFGIQYDMGRYPGIGIEEHFNNKRQLLEQENPNCITRTKS